MLQNGHHRLKAAKDLNLEKIKVDEIIAYDDSVRLGITELPFGKIPDEY
ncbi:MAG: hypothetical protein IJC76_02590 [Lachnospiraceae bacterium]|nr:hypothetical protein [Lachnospiraceae bacterium]